ncbi:MULTISPECIES: type VII secretion protein EssA [Metabacillus]|jgi:type VII secretion protein EssA|uniref:Type VII secretion protein EssA n=1 Tax=Metabacillus rhizolycopersici TaxID=2875709 RepID=A0ABS7UP02_9BACI|nr:MULTISPECIES: type VII secretion protein EssA [Metabacillus]MBZ5750036.1 type VII secretion protein EssA [Metabacillus rhizolycopersici]MCM3653177.1 type VII secretion protein EssA [Metabacillus litoralis]
MKRKRAIAVSIILLMINLFHLTVAGVVHAETSKIDELVPNDYQKNEFKSNKSLLNNTTQTNQLKDIPEEIKEITFEEVERSKDEAIKAELFLGESTDQNTIKAKAVDMQLFLSAEAPTMKQKEEDSSSSSSLSLTILIWALVGICILLLIVVLVVWGKSLAKQKSPQNV